MREGSSEEDEGGKVLKVDENIKVPKRRANRSVINLAPSKKSVLCYLLILTIRPPLRLA